MGALDADPVARCEDDVLRATREPHAQVRRDEPEEAVRGQLVGHRLQRHGVVASSVTARISSVTSMPTGHHVMQRPQPTQPDVPNWSHQVENASPTAVPRTGRGRTAPP
jgi:hypothetical protein